MTGDDVRFWRDVGGVQGEDSFLASAQVEKYLQEQWRIGLELKDLYTDQVALSLIKKGVSARWWRRATPSEFGLLCAVIWEPIGGYNWSCPWRGSGGNRRWTMTGNTEHRSFWRALTAMAPKWRSPMAGPT